MRPLLLATAAVLILLISAPRSAEAKGIVVVNTGDDILYLHDIPEAALAVSPDLEGYKVGFKYSLFGVFWLDVWRWDGEFVIYKDHEYEPIPEELRADFGVGSTPIGYQFPPGLLLILCGVLFLIAAHLSNRRVMWGMTTALAAGTVALHFAGLGTSTIIPAFTAAVLLVIAFGKEPASD